jgi:hypothetical protein
LKSNVNIAGFLSGTDSRWSRRLCTYWKIFGC